MICLLLLFLAACHAQSCTYTSTYGFGVSTGTCGANCGSKTAATAASCGGGQSCCVEPACAGPTNQPGVCKKQTACATQSFSSSSGASGCQPFPADILCCVSSSTGGSTSATLFFDTTAQMRFSQSASLLTAGASANVLTATIRVENDNNDNSLPGSWRYWWHFGVKNLPAGGGTLHGLINAQDIGFSDVVLPVVSFDGGQTFARIAGPMTNSGGFWRFSVPLPAGVSEVRVAKFYPYTLARLDAFLAARAANPLLVALPDYGTSNNGQRLRAFRIGSGKRRVWFHSAAHPAENTAYFVMEGVIDFLLSADPAAVHLRARCTIYLLPMVNPDGVQLGNSRTNARSENLEEYYGAPFGSNVGRATEAAAIKTLIEQVMNMPDAHAFPLEVLFNLHSTHSYSRPLHFRHVVPAVEPRVNARETRWIDTFKRANAIVNQGPTLSSSLSPRKYVESFMHDRYSLDPLYNVSVMAITFEGTYIQETDLEYIQIGRDMGRALFDFMFPTCGADGARCDARQQCQAAVPTTALACPSDMIGANGGLICCADQPSNGVQPTPQQPTPQQPTPQQPTPQQPTPQQPTPVPIHVVPSPVPQGWTGVVTPPTPFAPTPLNNGVTPHMQAPVTGVTAANTLSLCLGAALGAAALRI